MIDYFKLSKFFLYLIPLAIIFVVPSVLFPFIVGKYVFFRAVVDLALVLFLLGLLLQDKALIVSRQLLAVLKSPLVIAVSVFVFIFVLAGFLGVDPAFSFWSNFERGEGGFQMIHLWIFFILLITLFKEEKDWKKLFWISIIAGIFMIAYGLGAGLKYVDAEYQTKIIDNISSEQVLTGRGGPLYNAFKNFIGPTFNGPEYRFSGSIGNPAYVATYLIFILFYVGYLFINWYIDRNKLDKRDQKQKMIKSNNLFWLIGLMILFFIFF